MLTRRVCQAAILAAGLVAPAGDLLATGFPDFSTVDVGGIVVVTPKYEGSKEYEVFGAPLIFPAGFGDNSRVKVKGLDHVQFRLFDIQGFEFGPLAGYRTGRDEEDGDRLRGLGDIDGGLVIGGYAAYRFGAFTAQASYHHEVTGDDETGGLVKLGLEAVAQVAPNVKLTGGIGTTFADSDYMQSFFRVTAAQSARSQAGLAQYDTDAGIKDVNFSLTTDVAFAQRWNLKLIGRYSRLVGDAADSPVIETEDQFFGGAALTYRFDWSR